MIEFNNTMKNNDTFNFVAERASFILVKNNVFREEVVVRAWPLLGVNVLSQRGGSDREARDGSSYRGTRLSEPISDLLSETSRGGRWECGKGSDVRQTMLSGGGSAPCNSSSRSAECKRSLNSHRDKTELQNRLPPLTLEGCTILCIQRNTFLRAESKLFVQSVFGYDLKLTRV